MLTEKEIKLILLNRLCPPAHATFFNVGNGTGGHLTNYADVVSICLWQSRGYEITGFEIKTSRGDFLNEMKRPQKAEAVMKYCDRWFLIASGGIIKKEEVPKNWGFMEIRGDRIFTPKPAPLLTPLDFDRSFAVALLRRATESTIPAEVHYDAINSRKDEIKKELQKEFEGKILYAEGRTIALERKIAEFEKISGLSLEGWNSPVEVGRAVNWLLNNAYTLERFPDQLTNFIDNLKEFNHLVAEIKKIKGGN